MANQKPVVLLGTAPNFTGVGEMLTADRLEGIVNESDLSNNSVIIKTNGGSVTPAVLGSNTIVGNIGSGIAVLSAADIQTLLVNVLGLDTAGQIVSYDGTDFQVIDPGTDGQALIYNSAVNGGLAPGSISSTLAALSDTTISSPADTQVLQHNGSAWVNAALTVSDISDIDLTGLADGDTLVYDLGSTTWLVAAASGADNLGNHTATQDLAMDGNAINTVTRVGFDATMYFTSTAWIIAEASGDLVFAVNPPSPTDPDDYVITMHADGDISFEQYANTRDDSGTLTPTNFLYTSAAGLLFSAPITELSIPANLGDLGDVDTAGAANTDVLTYDGAEWVPAAAPTASFVATATANLDMADFNITNVDTLFFNNAGAASDWSVVENGAGSLLFNYGATLYFSMTSVGVLGLGAYGSARPDDSGSFAVDNLIYTTASGAVARAVVASMPESSANEVVTHLFFRNASDEMELLELADLPAYDDQTAATSGGSTSGHLWKASATNTMSVPTGTLIVSP